MLDYIETSIFIVPRSLIVYMRIDAYAHDVPEKYYNAMGEFSPTDVQKRHAKIGGFFDYDRRIEHLDEHNIDKQVIALGAPHFWKGIEPSEEALELVQLANDEIREVASSYPDRYIPVGTLPIDDKEMMLNEFDRCISDLDMVGIQIYTNYEGRPIDDEWLHPIYEKAEREGVPIWLHPQVHDWFEWSDDWGLDLTYGWLFDTTMALARLVFSGLMERYSDMKLITHHGGGMVPHFMERVDLFYGPTYEDGVYSFDIIGESYEELQQPLGNYFRKFYGDAVLYGSVPSLRTVYEFYGPDHLIFGTDYPYGGDNGQDFMQACTEAMEELDIPDKDKEKIFSKNIHDLIE